MSTSSPSRYGVAFLFDHFATSVLGICEDNINQFLLHCWKYSRKFSRQDPVRLWHTKLDIYRHFPTSSSRSNDTSSFAMGSGLLKEFILEEKGEEDEEDPSDFLSIVITRNWSESVPVLLSETSKYFYELSKDASSKLATITIPLIHIHKIMETNKRDKHGRIFVVSVPVLDFDVFMKEQGGEVSELGFINLVFYKYEDEEEEEENHIPNQFCCYLFSNARQLICNYINKDLSSHSSLQFENTKLMLNHLLSLIEERDISYWFEDCAETLFKDIYWVNPITSTAMYSAIVKLLFPKASSMKKRKNKKDADDDDAEHAPLIINILWKINTNLCEKWYKLNMVTHNYIKERKSVIKKDGILEFNYSKSLQLTFHPDVSGLKSFNRFYWTYENLKIPYPHLTKIFVQPIHSISNSFFPPSSDYYPRPLLENEKMARTIFTKMLSQSCWKYGLSEQHYCDTIRSVFLIEGNDSSGEDSIVSPKISYYWLSKTSFGHFMLLQCIRIMADFLFSLSCSLYYKMDRRMVVNNNKDDNIGNSKCKLLGKLIDIDSLDFESFLGICQDADCDEVGLYINVVYSQVLGLHEDQLNNESLKCTKMLLQNYTDFCTFSVVDSAQFEGASNEEEEEEEGRDKENISFLYKNSQNLLYNEYDLKTDCNTGHTSVIFWPTLHVDCALEQYHTAHSNLNIAKTFLQHHGNGAEPTFKDIREHFRKQSYSKLYGEKVAKNMPNFGKEDEDRGMKKSKYLTLLLTHVFPRIPLEGTAPQDALSLYMSHYYISREDEEKSLRSEKVNALINLHANVKKIQHCLVKMDLCIYKFLNNKEELLSHHRHHGKASTGGRKQSRLLLSECEYCDYQSLKDFGSSYFQQKNLRVPPLEKRVISFYRRPAQSTSQMLRYIFNNNHLVDAFTWVDYSKMTWAPPMRHILECFPRTFSSSSKEELFNHVIPLPVPQNVTNSYLRGSKDVWVEQNLQNRIPFFKKWLAFDSSSTPCKEKEYNEGIPTYEEDSTFPTNVDELSTILLGKLYNVTEEERRESKMEDGLETLSTTLKQFGTILDEGLGVLKTKYNYNKNDDENYFSCSYIKLKKKLQVEGRDTEEETQRIKQLVTRLKVVASIFNKLFSGRYNLEFDWQNTSTLPWFTDEIFFRFNIT